MRSRQFRSVIRIQDQGSDATREVATIQDAREVLTHWPRERRGPRYKRAREIVEAALRGEATCAHAQESFMSLCAHFHIVAPR
jgi:hypothetical protein